MVFANKSFRFRRKFKKAQDKQTDDTALKTGSFPKFHAAQKGL